MNKKILFVLLCVFITVLSSGLASAENFTRAHGDDLGNSGESNELGFYCIGMNATMYLQNVTVHPSIVCD